MLAQTPTVQLSAAYAHHNLAYFKPPLVHAAARHEAWSMRARSKAICDAHPTRDTSTRRPLPRARMPSHESRLYHQNTKPKTNDEEQAHTLACGRTQRKLPAPDTLARLNTRPRMIAAASPCMRGGYNPMEVLRLRASLRSTSAVVMRARRPRCLIGARSAAATRRASASWQTLGSTRTILLAFASSAKLRAHHHARFYGETPASSTMSSGRKKWHPHTCAPSRACEVQVFGRALWLSCGARPRSWLLRAD